MAKKKKSKQKNLFSIDAYGGVIFHVVVGKKQYIKYFGHPMDECAEAEAVTFEDADFSGVKMVAVSFRSASSITRGIVAHECLHAAWNVLHIIGSSATKDNHEHLAYLMEWMIERVFEVKKGLK
ncbi:MAG: hypothetical protein ACRDCY_07900 [Aeromonas veronii]